MPVSALFLFQALRQYDSGAAASHRADPLWRLRALIIGSALVALSGPVWQDTSTAPVEVWVDDSLSMQALEQGESRLGHAFQQLIETLAPRRSREIVLHSLGTPNQRLQIGPAQPMEQQALLREWRKIPVAEPHPPASTTLRPEALHYLLTDGADAALNRWSGQAPLQQLIRVGTATDNLALTLLSLRPALTEPDSWMGLVALSNLGKTRVMANLEVANGSGKLLDWPLDLEPDSSIAESFRLQLASLEGLYARLSPTGPMPLDALPLDDQLTLPFTQRARLYIGISGDCSRYLLAALRSDRGVGITTLEDPRIEAQLLCGDLPLPSATPTIRLHPIVQRRLTTSAPHWHAAAGKLQQLLLQRLEYSSSAPQATPTQQLLLSGDGRALILAVGEPVPRIEIFLDMASSELTSSPLYPLLLSGLFEQLLQRSSDDEIIRVERDPQASRIAPLVGNQPALRTTPAATMAQHELGWILLLCILSLLLLDGYLSLATAGEG